MIVQTEHTESQIVLMSEREARGIMRRINARMADVRNDLLELYDREGWRALGYASWEACTTAEFGQSRAQLYRLLSAAQTERDLHLETGDLPESHLRELGKAPKPDRPKVLDRANQIAGDKPRTAKHITQAVEEIAPLIVHDQALLEQAAAINLARARMRSLPAAAHIDYPTALIASITYVLEQWPASPRGQAKEALEFLRSLIGSREKAVMSAQAITNGLAGKRLEDMAEALDDATYEALAAYRRAREPVPTLADLESEVTN